ncbi:MAG: septation protein A [Betaproteobacteria bacterium]|nr:septation protein A [Betaproteobacteria bacterium]
MKFLFDLIPVLVFFVAYYGAGHMPDTASALTSAVLGDLGLGTDFPPAQAPILLATAAAIVATFGQVLWLLLRGKKVDKMLWISLSIIVVMGGLTLALRDPTFIKWKPTLLYWAFAVVLLGSQLFFGRNLIRSAAQDQIVLPESVWRNLNLSWAGFFVFMGVLNLYVAFNFTEDTWVKFKLIGGMGLMLLFALAQGLVLSRYAEQPEEGK